MSIIGLTGNLGMGKSTVLNLFRKLGAHTYSADDFVHNILTYPVIITRITDLFGQGVLAKKRGSDQLDRNKIAGIVFRDNDSRRDLEKIIHPEVMNAIKVKSSEVLAMDPDGCIVFEVPLLFEAGYEDYFDSTVVVCTTQENALTRAIKKGMSRAEFKRRNRAQMSIAQKKKMADYIIDNDDNISKTRGQVMDIYSKLCGN